MIQYLQGLLLSLLLITSAFAQKPAQLTPKQEDIWTFFSLHKDELIQRFRMVHQLQHRNKRPSQMSKAILQYQIKHLEALFVRCMWVFDLHLSHYQVKQVIARKRQKQPWLDLVAYNFPYIQLQMMIEGSCWGWQSAREALYINQVSDAYSEDNYAKALKIANKNLQENPEDGVSLLYKGLVLADSLNKPALIEEYTTRALVATPDLHKAYYYRARYYVSVGKKELARQDIDRALLYWAESPRYLLHSVLIHLQMKQLDEAEKALDKVLRLNDRYVEAYLAKGNIHLFRKNYDLALIDFTKAIRLDSSNHHAFSGSGVAYQKLGKYTKALTEFNKAIALNKEAYLYAERGDIYRLLGKHEEALRDYDQSIALGNNNFTPFEGKAFTLLSLKEYDKALAMFKLTLTKKIPADNKIYTYNNIGHTYYKMGKYAEALKHINYSLSKNNKNSYAYKNRALVYIAQGKKALACADLTKAQALGYRKLFGNEVQELQQKHCR
ncbi:tetratricopeptide repeat protein [Microscilla marina]|uniref:Tetratricopeptide repeat family protein, putative n=1 Tax=Microscilla marina ATCC 23134 TaxID=313606 RepID=A1ZSA8_MICM2|nr:tetratricopeptide repeat protein [Microscilla marina]EAY26656.1 tetratricopeptide repeat family protein, putative [Microscilla marina ATCC 23134]